MPDNAMGVGHNALAAVTKKSPTWDCTEWKKQMQSVAKDGKHEPQEIQDLWSRAEARRKKEPKDGESFDNTLMDAIFETINRGDVKTLKGLVKCDSKILARKHSEEGRTALHEAVRKGAHDMVSALLSHSRIIMGIDTRDKHGRTALHEAAEKDQGQGIIGDLLANGADIDVVDEMYITPLHAAVLKHQHHEESVVNFLIENGAKVNTRDRTGRSFFTFLPRPPSCTSGNLTDSQPGSSPLHAATTQAVEAVERDSKVNDPEKIMRLLLENGADPDAPNTDGTTPRNLVPVHASGSGPLPKAMTRVRVIFDETQGKPFRKNCWKVPQVKPLCVPKREGLTRNKFFANIYFYYRGPKPRPMSYRVSIFELVYGGKLKELEQEYIGFLRKEHGGTQIERKDVWKWVHFPANNVSSLISS